LVFFAGATVAAEEEAHWPQFRGPQASGQTHGPPIPTAWSGETGQGILWKTEVPGLGHSSPVVWGDRIYLTSAISGKKDPKLKVGLYGDIAPVKDDTVHRYMVYALNRATGKIVWERMAHEGVPKIKRHTKASHANSTPVTDGKHVVVNFGAEGLYCYDVSGELVWKKDLGELDAGFFMVPQAQWGYGSSPVIHAGVLLIQADVQKDSFLAAFDAASGKQLWRTARDEVPTWGSPAPVEVGDATHVVVNGWKHIGAYDLADGKEIWKFNGLGDIPTPTPVFGHGMAFITSAHGAGSPIYAVKLDAKGDISLKDDALANDGIAWSVQRGGAYMPTPVLAGDLLYVSKDNGTLAVFDARSGERKYQERLGGGKTGFTASSVASGGHLFVTSELGETFVVKLGETFELVSQNEIGEIVMASPAIAAGTLYLRGQKHLFAIGEARPAD
jgi:outer membrane protein assembly factor BamB